MAAHGGIDKGEVVVTVVFSGVPGGPTGFTATADVVAVSVSFVGGRVEERAYRDGVFLHPYLQSTQGGGVFSLVRSGGWPTGWREVFVDEAIEVPTTGSEWGAIYTLDLTAQSTFTLANGANTIDGLTWYSKGSSGFVDAVVNNVLNGSGLECGSAAFSASGNYAYRMPWFPFAQIADYNPDAPVAVAFRFSGSGLSSSNYLIAGLASMADDGTQWLSGERATQAYVKYEGAADALIHSVGTGSLNPVSGLSPSSATYGDHAFVESRLAANVFTSGHAGYSGSLPVDIFALADGLNPVVEATARSNLGFFFTRNRSTAFTAYLTHLQVMQPRAAA